MNPTGVLKSKRWCIKGTVQQREVKMDFNRMFVHVCVHQRLRTDRHSNKTFRITITLRVYDPTFMSAGGDGDGVSDVPTFIRVKPVDISVNGPTCLNVL